MNPLPYLVISLAVSCFAVLHFSSPICPGTVENIYVDSTVGWMGFGFAWTTWSQYLHNITIAVNLATVELEENTTFLGSIRMLHFHKLRSTEDKTRWNINFEIKFPIQDPLPDITALILNGDYICATKENAYNSSKPVKIKVFMEYNHFTKYQTSSAKIVAIHTPKPTTALDQRFPVVDDVECGTIDYANIFQSLVLHGQTITRGSWPWLVSIFSYTGPRLGFQCGATLISNKVVITAAHCFFDRYNRQLPTEDVLLILGQHNLKRPHDQGTQIVYPHSINIHKNYRKRNTIDSDIAVVVLAEVVRFTTFIRPACLWKGSESKDSLVGLNGVTAGWGRDEHGNFFTELPKKAEIPVVSDETCLRSHDAFTKITSEVTFCAGWRNGTDGPCNGDSGGGLMFEREGRWTLRGVVSTSLTDRQSNLCDLKEYVVFTDVVSFVVWIETFLVE
ncbi:serine protease gd-like [Lutzomyia longipalpis]|uniref:serine protease gd-like n=1 Tax=Lutzomyia longipalpis TaxID=7200 RepID=UPI002483A6E0|nr:serine protease gd-like [Lutzomyia longipalpis]